MKNLIFIILALGFCSAGYSASSIEAKKYVLTRDTKIPYLAKKEFMKLSSKEKKEFLAALRKAIVALAEKPKPKYSFSFEFFKKAYANENSSFCIDNTGHRQLAISCNPLPRECRSGVQCAPIFGERVCISPSSPITACAQEYEAYPLATRNYFQNLWQSNDKQNYMQQIQGLCNQGSAASNCEGLVSYLRTTGQQPILDAVIYSAPAGAVAPTRQRPQRSAEATGRDSSVTRPQRRRNRQVTPRVSGSFPRASSAAPDDSSNEITEFDPNEAIANDGNTSQASNSESFNQAFDRIGNPSSAVPTPAVASMPVAQQQDFDETVRCSTGELTVNRRLRGPSDRQPFLSIDEVKQFFCTRQPLSDAQVQDLRNRINRYTSRFVQEGRSRSAARARTQTINQFKSILNNCISKNQRGEFPPGTPQVSMSCTANGVCTVNGTPLPNGAGRGYSQARQRRSANGSMEFGYTRAVTSKGMIGTIVDMSGWQWCQVSEGSSQPRQQQRPAPSVRTTPSNS